MSIPLSVASTAANIIANLLQTACTSVTVCGSIRRGEPEVSDLDLVLLPIPDPAPSDLFGDPIPGPPSYSRLDALLASLAEKGILLPESGAQKQRTMRAGSFLEGLQGCKVELYLATQINHGDILVLRTGCEAFSTALFTSINDRGVLPVGWRHDKGVLWHWGEIVLCPTEEAFFNAVGVPFVPPTERTLETARLLAQQAREAARRATA